MAEPKSRKCVACGRSSTKPDLVRFVRTADGSVELDPTGRKPGRGAYVCQDPACYEAARKRRAFDRALRTKLDAETYDRLGNEFNQLCASHSAQ